MDYKYIEQLLERYWECNTSQEEENILKAFFQQKDVPEGLRKYKGLFDFQMEAKNNECLSVDFDKRIMSIIDNDKKTHVKAVRLTLRRKMMPLFKAAAVVAIIVSLGGAAQFQFGKQAEGDDINYANYKDTFSDPSMAYDKVEDALEMVSEGFSLAQNDDSLANVTKIDTNVKSAE